MPIIPGPEKLGDTPSYNSGRAVVTAGDYDTSAKYKGMEKIGTALQGVGVDIAAREEKRRKEEEALDLLKADLIHKKGVNSAERDLENDPDYDTHDQKFSGRAAGAADEAAGVIRNPEARERWKMKAAIENEGARESVLKRADSIGRQQRVVDLDKVMEEHRNTYTSPDATPEQRQAARRGMDEAIQMGERSGLLRPLDARTKRNEFINGAEVDDIKRRMIEDPEHLLRDLSVSGADRGGNLTDAQRELKLTPEETSLYEQHLRNLWGKGGVDNKDGSRSTLYQTTVTVDDKAYLIPTVWGGKILPPKEAIERAKKEGFDKFPSYDSVEDAEDRYQKMHSYMERDTAGYLQSRGKIKSIPHAMISGQLETGQTDPMKGVANISEDSDDTKSYGNFGLNSGGSLQAFMKEYGGSLDIKGTPGTAAFDKNWKAFAAAEPEALHAAEMQWYQEKILPRITADLTNNGVPSQVAGDERVQAYMADRLIQYGPNSIKSYSQRIQRAADASEGDPLAFIKAMSEADTANIGSDFRTAIATVPKTATARERYMSGLSSRVSKREALSTGQGGSGPGEGDGSAGGAYPTLTPLQRAQFLDETKKRLRTEAEGSRMQYKQMLDDDVASIRSTGKGIEDLDIDGAVRVLNKSQISGWEVNRMKAQAEYEGLHDLNDLSDNQLEQRLDKLRPASGEAYFDIKQQVYSKASTAANQIREQRLSDPAKSVEKQPDVRQALQNTANAPGDPAATQELVRTRIDAQNRVGISPNMQSPITTQEARTLASRVKGLSGKSLTEAMVPLQQDLENTYGPYARSVGVAMLHTITRDRELADRVQGILDKTFKGIEPSASQLRNTEILNEGSLAARSFGGDYVGSPAAQYGQGAVPQPGGFRAKPKSYFGLSQPPARAIADLQANPALAITFDAKYGTGAAATALGTPLQQEEPSK